MANFINKYLNQSAYDADTDKDYPNTSLVNNVVVYQMTEPTPTVFDGLTVTYNIEDTSIEVTLFKGGGGSSSSSSESESGGGGAMPTTMIVDGVSETPINTWRFETTGEHTVQYEFEDNTVPESFLSFGELGTGAKPTEVIVGTDITDINSQAFDNSYLTSATCLSTTPPTLPDSTVFGGGGENYPIYVPAESVNTYKAASRWSDFASRIHGIGTSSEPVPSEPVPDSPL